MRHLTMILSSLILSFNAYGQMTYTDVVNTIIENNNELKSKLKLIEAQKLDDSDGNALSNPEVAFSRVWGRHDIGNKLQLDVTQSMEWPGVYGARSKANSAAAEVAMMEYESEALELKMQVREKLNELVYVREQIRAVNQIESNFSALEQAVEKGVKEGELTKIDQRKIAIERYQLTNMLYSLRMREHELTSALQGMCQVEMDFSGITSYEVQQLMDKDTYLTNIEWDPEVEAQQLTARQEKLNEHAAKMQMMPNISVGYQHQAEMGDRFNGFTLGMTLPVFEGRKAKKSAIERREAADLSRETLINQKKAEIEGLYASLHDERRQIEEYKEVFGDNLYLDLLLKAYKGGQINVLDYIMEIRYYTENTMTYLEIEYAYNQTLTSINRYLK